MKIRKIYVVASLHGDEPFGLKVLAHLRYIHDRRVVARVGHPEAIAKRKEFLEANLNRCFGKDAPQSKEKLIAEDIKGNIEFHKPDLIIDLHTCECAVGKSAILAKKNKDLINIAKQIGLNHVFVGVPEVTRQSLLGYKSDRTMVIELGKGYRSDVLAEQIAKKIVGLLDVKNDVAEASPIAVYSNSRYIKKAEAGRRKLENYTFDKKLNGYPYLVGNNTYGKYSDYVGFISANEELL